VVDDVLVRLKNIFGLSLSYYGGRIFARKTARGWEFLLVRQPTGSPVTVIFGK